MASSETRSVLPEIPVMVEGVQKWVTGLTPKTTCDDVIHSLLINIECPAPHESVFDYALFENWRGVERPLKGRSKFVKLWKDWGGERSNVQLTLRKVDSSVKNDVMGSTSKRKYKNWFKKTKPVAAKQSVDTNIGADVTNIHDDSSMIMQNKENLLCAFNCYSKKKSSAAKGLKERDSNLKTPFERPRSVLNSPSMNTISFIPNGESMTSHDTITCIYSKEQQVTHVPEITQYGSTASIKRATGIYGSSSRLREDNIYSSTSSLKRSTSSAYGSSAGLRNNVGSAYASTVTLKRGSDYGSTATLKENIYSSTATLKKENKYASSSSLRKNLTQRRDSLHTSGGHYQCLEPVYTSNNHIYDYPFPKKAGRNLPQNPVDWDWDFSSDSAESEEELQDVGLYANNRFKSLLNIVLTQEKRIRQQLDRIKEADQQIEDYEYRLHSTRSQQQGKDYLQDTYLKDILSGEVPQHEVNMYETMVENLVDMDAKLVEQYKQLEDLSTMIHNESQPVMNDTDAVGGPLESTRIDPAIQKQIDELRQQLQETVNMSVARDNEMKELDTCLSKYEQQMKDKESRLANLMSELNDSLEKKEVAGCSADELTRQLRESENYIRTLMSSVTKKPRLEYREMGIDVGRVPSSCDTEVEKILHQDQHLLTPVAVRDHVTPSAATPLGVSVNAILEYNNETIDLDTLCNMGRPRYSAKKNRQSPYIQKFKPICNETDDAKQGAPSKPDFLPPVGIETVAKVFSSKLMPDLTLVDNHDVMTSPGMSQFNETSLWNTEDDGIDVTFSSAPEPRVVENTYFTSPNKTNALLESTANLTCDSPATITSRPPRPANQPANQKSRVKKKLFLESHQRHLSENKCNDLVEREIKEVMYSLTGDLSNSRLSESSESGVGSLHGEDSNISTGSTGSGIETTV